MTLKEVRQWCAARGVKEHKLVMRAYKRQEGGMDQERWLDPLIKVERKIDGMTPREVAAFINEKLNTSFDHNDVRINRRDQLVKSPNRSDDWIIAFMLVSFLAKKWKEEL